MQKMPRGRKKWPPPQVYPLAKLAFLSPPWAHQDTWSKSFCTKISLLNNRATHSNSGFVPAANSLRTLRIGRGWNSTPSLFCTEVTDKLKQDIEEQEVSLTWIERRSLKAGRFGGPEGCKYNFVYHSHEMAGLNLGRSCAKYVLRHQLTGRLHAYDEKKYLGDQMIPVWSNRMANTKAQLNWLCAVLGNTSQGKNF